MSSSKTQIPWMATLEGGNKWKSLQARRVIQLTKVYKSGKEDGIARKKRKHDMRNMNLEHTYRLLSSTLMEMS